MDKPSNPVDAARSWEVRPTRPAAIEGKPHLLVQRFRLEVIAGPDQGKTYDSNSERATVGKHESCDVVLTDETVSRFHCEIAVVDNHVEVRDLGSRNGTHVDRVRLMHGFLRNGSTLSVGDSRLRFDVVSEDVSISLSEAERFGMLVGASPAMRMLFALLERAAQSDATVLIEGESGTGKDVAAESIHLESTRREKPFVVVDCGALPPELLESELFGHERGAFTGAHAERAGAFEEANGGTLFIDEIGELGPALQPKLLRALEKPEIKRVGASTYVPVDVRVIAASNRNLRVEVNQKRFRSDLYYRLAVLVVRMPPLRQRLDDLPFLARDLLRTLGTGKDVDQSVLSPAFVEALALHHWPGNVRELRNYLERCLVLRERALGEHPPDQAPVGLPAITASEPMKRAREVWSRSFERLYVEDLMRCHAGNVSAAAQAAGVSRVYLYRLLARYRIR